MIDREAQLMAEVHTIRLLLRHVCEKCSDWEVLVNEDKTEEIRRAARLRPKWLIHDGYKYVLEENSND